MTTILLLIANLGMWVLILILHHEIQANKRAIQLLEDDLRRINKPDEAFTSTGDWTPQDWCIQCLTNRTNGSILYTSGACPIHKL